jgi:serine/threonine-protein kinase
MGSSASVESFLRVGDVVGGKYRIVRRIGQGGMGSVYEAENMSLGRTLALKFLEPHLAKSPHLVERFMREARAAATLTHPNVVYVFDVGWLEDGRLPYMAMELLGGQTLAAAVQGGRLAVERAVAIILQILDALDAAHAKGIVHRDLKPANVFLLRGDVVKILDFGISKMLGTGDKLTATGSVLGTPSYMSPEQARGAKTTDHRTDLYGVGAILSERRSGVAPYAGDSYTEILFKLATESPVPIATIRPDVPVAVVAFLDRTMRRNPDERFASAREMQGALLAITSGAAAGADRSVVGEGRSLPPEILAPTPAPTPAAWEITHPADVVSLVSVPISGSAWTPTGAPGTTDPHSLARTAPSGGTRPAPSRQIPRPVIAGGISAAVVLAILAGIAAWSASDAPVGPGAGAGFAGPAATPPAWPTVGRAPSIAPPPSPAVAPPAAACRHRVSVVTAPATVTLDGTATTREIDAPAPCGARARLMVESSGFRTVDREVVAGPSVQPALLVELTRVVAAASSSRRETPRSGVTSGRSSPGSGPAQTPQGRRSDAPPAPAVKILEPNPFHP